MSRWKVAVEVIDAQRLLQATRLLIDRTLITIDAWQAAPNAKDRYEKIEVLGNALDSLRDAESDLARLANPTPPNASKER